MLIVKIEHENFHYCPDCARTFIASARRTLNDLEAELPRNPATAEMP